MNEPGSLSQCMMDDDSEGLGRARSIRRKALLASSMLEFGLLAVLLVWPLITPGVLSNRVAVMPLPPFHGLPQTHVASSRANETSVSQNIHLHIMSTSVRYNGIDRMQPKQMLQNHRLAI